MKETLVNRVFGPYKSRMPVILKDRQKQIPYGYKFYQPETGWRPKRHASFYQIVQQVISHRKGNPVMTQKHGWRLDTAGVEQEVDAFNAKLCFDHGWHDYIMGTGVDASPPKLRPRSASGAVAAGADLVGGATALVEMFGEGGRPVASALAATRAAICASCPKNEQGDWTRFFTEPASMLIRKMLGIVKDLDLRTPHDDKLQICGVCYCPLKTKVWANRSHILRHLKPELQSQLPGHCWIRNEK